MNDGQGTDQRDDADETDLPESTIDFGSPETSDDADRRAINREIWEGGPVYPDA